ncbi:MAG TPA: TRAP transporter large permease subunit, partial [Deltaproteobacteria bacterium]|nr:TRAP transporter large permease subunit [Deltaproteobacteria bacterium]
GTVMPPSVVLIVIGLQTEQSIIKLFLAGILPAILLGSPFYSDHCRSLQDLSPFWSGRTKSRISGKAEIAHRRSGGDYHIRDGYWRSVYGHFYAYGSGSGGRFLYHRCHRLYTPTYLEGIFQFHNGFPQDIEHGFFPGYGRYHFRSFFSRYKASFHGCRVCFLSPCFALCDPCIYTGDLSCGRLLHRFPGVSCPHHSHIFSSWDCAWI